MEIDKEIYNGIEIKHHYNKENKSFYATSKIANSSNHNCKVLEEAIENVKNKIDVFLKTAPKTYAELATEIENSLVWDGYEECHVDEEILKHLVSSFIKTQK